MSLKSAVVDFLALIDGEGRVDDRGQVIDAGGGYSQEQYDDAIRQIRVEAGVPDPLAAGAEPKERDSA